MAFSNRYRAENLVGADGLDYDVYILEDGYAGAVTDITLVPPAFRIETGQRGDDLDAGVSESVAVLYISAASDTDYSDLDAFDEGTKRLDIYQSGSLVFRGFLEPYLIERALDTQQVLKVEARVGLTGYLDNITHPDVPAASTVAGTRQTAFYFLRRALDQLGYGLGYKVIDNYYPFNGGTGSGLDAFYIDPYALGEFAPGNDTPAGGGQTCAEVINAICTKLLLNIRQANGLWYIRQIESVASGTATERTYNSGGTLTGTATVTPAITLADASFIQTGSPATCRAERPYGSVSLQHRHGQVGRQAFVNGGFEADSTSAGGSGVVPSGWTATNSARTYLERGWSVVLGGNRGVDEFGYEPNGYHCRIDAGYMAESGGKGGYTPNTAPPTGYHTIYQTTTSFATGVSFQFGFAVRMDQTSDGPVPYLDRPFVVRIVLIGASTYYWNNAATGGGAWELASGAFNSVYVTPAQDNRYAWSLDPLPISGTLTFEFYPIIDDRCVQVASTAPINYVAANWKRSFDYAYLDAIYLDVISGTGAEVGETTTIQAVTTTPNKARLRLGPHIWGDGPTSGHRTRITLTSGGTTQATDWQVGSTYGVPSGKALETFITERAISLFRQARRRREYAFRWVSATLYSPDALDVDGVRYWQVYHYWQPLHPTDQFGGEGVAVVTGGTSGLTASEETGAASSGAGGTGFGSSTVNPFDLTNALLSSGQVGTITTDATGTLTSVTADLNDYLLNNDQVIIYARASNTAYVAYLTADESPGSGVTVNIDDGAGSGVTMTIDAGDPIYRPAVLNTASLRLPAYTAAGTPDDGEIKWIGPTGIEVASLEVISVTGSDGYITIRTPSGNIGFVTATGSATAGSRFELAGIPLQLDSIAAPGGTATTIVLYCETGGVLKCYVGTSGPYRVLHEGITDATLNARVAVSKNSGATVGTRRRINFIEGSNVTLTVADDSGNEEVDVTIAAASGGGVSSSTPGSDQNDYAPADWTTKTVHRLSPTATILITGFSSTGISDGDERKVINTATDYMIILPRESTSSAAANRITGGASSIPRFLMPGEAVTLWYDATSARWRYADAVPTPEAQFHVWTECLDQPNTTAGYPFRLAVAGTGASGQAGTYLNNSTERPWGIVQVDTGTTATGKAFLEGNSVSGMVPAQGCALFLTRLAVEALSDGTNTYQVFAGFHDASGGTNVTDGVYWAYRHGSSANWMRSAAAASARTETAGATAVGTTYVWLGIFVNANWTRADFFLSTDSVAWTVEGTVTTNLPSATQVLAPSVGINKTVGTTQRNLSIDWMGCRYDLVRG